MVSIVIRHSDTAETSKYELDQTQTVLELKSRVEQEYGKQVERQVLIYKGHLLANDATVGSLLNDATEATFHLVVKPGDGGQDSQPEPRRAVNQPQAELQPEPRANQPPGQNPGTNQNPGPNQDPGPNQNTGQNQNNPENIAYPLTSASDPLHVIRLSLPSGDGHQRSVTIPCYEYMIANTTDGLAFCMSPSALKKICDTGTNVQIPRLFTTAMPPQPLARRIVNLAVGLGQRFYDIFFLVFRLVLFIDLFALNIEDRLQFWAITIAMSAIVIYQSALFNNHLRQLANQLPRLNLRVANQVDRPNQGVVRSIASAIFMFVTTLIPGAHDFQ